MREKFLAQLELDFGGRVVWPSAELRLPTQWTHTKKALRAWLGIWGAAALCIPVPVIHLVFPPIGIVCGPFLGLLVYLKSRKEIEHISCQVTCPRCEHSFVLEEQAVHFPAYESCPHCKAGYAIYSWREATIDSQSSDVQKSL